MILGEGEVLLTVLAMSAKINYNVEFSPLDAKTLSVFTCGKMNQ